MARVVFVTLALVTVMSAEREQASDPAADEAVRLAREALARHLQGAPSGTPDLVSVTAVEWPSSALGCPQPETSYLQIVLDGHRVLLKVREVTYAVHVGGGRAVVCQPLTGAAASAPAPAVRADVPRRSARAAEVAAGLKLAERARAELATTLDIEPDRITIDFYRPTTWPDARLGCPDPSKGEPGSPTRGFRIQLRVEDRTYEFHSDMSRVVRCG